MARNGRRDEAEDQWGSHGQELTRGEQLGSGACRTRPVRRVTSVENTSQTGFHRDPDLCRCTGVACVTSRLGTRNAANLLRGDLEPAEHLCRCDLCRGAGELVAPFVAPALASDYPYRRRSLRIARRKRTGRPWASASSSAVSGSPDRAARVHSARNGVLDSG